MNQQISQKISISPETVSLQQKDKLNAHT